MSILSTHSIRYSLVLLGTVAAVGCSSEGVVNPDLGSISLSIATIRATVAQGGSQPVIATLTRAGGFTGIVNFRVTGQPAGVTATVSEVQTSGVVTTATLMIDVGAAAAGTYPLVVHGSGRGVSEATAVFKLTVPDAAVTISLSAPALTIQAGTSTPTTTVNLVRTNTTGPVTLYVDLDFHGGLPPGVKAAFGPNPTTSNSTVLTLTVGAAAVPGVYELWVYADVSGSIDGIPLTLTIQAALGYGLTLTSPALSIVQGGAPATATVNVVRDNFAGPIKLYVDNHGQLPPGVTAAFAPNPATGDSAVLTLTASAATVPGVYELWVYAEGSTGSFDGIPLTLTVTPVPGYSLTLSAPTLSIPQGASSSNSVTVSLVRTNFTGNVILSVENLPTGVTTYLQPWNDGSRMSGNFSQLQLSVAGNAPTGTFNLVVRGVASGLSDRTAPLTLAITAAPFILTLSPAAISIAKGAAPATTTVNVVRNNFTGPLKLYVDMDYHGTLPAGVTAAFAPNPTTGNSAMLTLTASAAAVPGVYELWVYAESSMGWYDGPPLTLTVTAP